MEFNSIYRFRKGLTEKKERKYLIPIEKFVLFAYHDVRGNARGSRMSKLICWKLITFASTFLLLGREIRKKWAHRCITR